MRIVILTLGLFLFTSFAFSQSVNKKLLINQISKLKDAILNDDKEAVASFFSFPITDKEILMDIESFNDNGIIISKLDKNSFIKYYSVIIPKDFKTLFIQLDISKLNSNDTVKKIVLPEDKTEICYYGYEISILKDVLNLNFFSNTRNDIVIQDGEMCEEYSQDWNFTFVKRRLKFFSLIISG